MSTDRHDPLDADERELARVLRALPAGEPPSALDAKILAMARDAVVTTPAQKDEAQPRLRRAPRLAWSLGVAASCVMAAGLVWRMGGFGAESLDVAGSALSDKAAESSIQPAPPMPEAAEEHIHVEIPPPRPAPIAPPPPPPPEEPPVRLQAPAAAAPAMAEQARTMEQRQDLSSRREQQAEASPPPEFAAAPAPAPVAEAASDAESRQLDTLVVTGARVRAVAGNAVDGVDADGNAGPQAWIQRIRARIDRGDLDGARASLEAFIERYPDKVLPQDLIDFRAGHDAQ